MNNYILVNAYVLDGNKHVNIQEVQPPLAIEESRHHVVVNGERYIGTTTVLTDREMVLFNNDPKGHRHDVKYINLASMIDIPHEDIHNTKYRIYMGGKLLIVEKVSDVYGVVIGEVPYASFVFAKGRVYGNLAGGNQDLLSHITPNASMMLSSLTRVNFSVTELKDGKVSSEAYLPYTQPNKVCDFVCEKNMENDITIFTEGHQTNFSLNDFSHL